MDQKPDQLQKRSEYFSNLSQDFQKTLKGVTEISEYGYALISKELRLIYVNPQMCSIVEIPEAELIGENIIDVLEKILPQPLTSASRDIFKDMYIDITTHQNNNIWLNKSKVMQIKCECSEKIKIIKSRTGSIESEGEYFAISVFEDITSRYFVTEGGIFANRYDCFDAFLNTLVPVMILDANNYKIIKINIAFQTYMGYSDMDLVGYSPEERGIIDNTPFADILNNCTEDGIIRHEIKTLEGKSVIATLCCNKVRINGDPYIVVKLFASNTSSQQRDVYLADLNDRLNDEIHKRKMLEISKNAMKEHYSEFIYDLPIGIYSTDYLGMFINANSLFIEILGYESQKDLKKHNLRDIFFSDADYERFQKNAVAKQQYATKIKLKRKDGSTVWVINHAIQLVDSESICRIEGTIEDITATVEMENTLRNNYLVYQNLFNGTSDILIALDSHKNIKAISPSFENVTSYRTADFIGKKFSDIFMDSTSNADFLKDFYSGKNISSNNQVVLIHNNIRPKFHSFNIDKQYDIKSHNLTGYLGIAHDITDMVINAKTNEIMAKIRQQIYDSYSINKFFVFIRNLLSEIIDTSAFAIAITDNDSQMVNFTCDNNKVFKYSGVSYNDDKSNIVKSIKSKKALLVNYDDGDKNASLRYCTTPQKTLMAIPMIINNNPIGALLFLSEQENRIVESDIEMMTPIAGRIAGAIDQKKTMLETENYHKLIQTIINVLPMPILCHDVDTLKIVMLNDTFCRLLGKSRSELSGKTRDDLYKDKYAYIAQKFHDIDKTMMQPDDKSERVEMKIPSADGSLRDMIIIRQVLFNTDNQPTKIVWVMLDITEQKQTEAHLIYSLQKENALNKSISSFNSMVSHEYKTPLQSISLAVELLQNYYDQLPTVKRQELLGKIADSVTLMNSLVNEILILNKLNQNAISYSPSLINIRQLFMSLINEAGFISQNKTQFDLECDLHSDYILVDGNLLKLIVKNLLSNADKYSPVGTIVKINVKSDEKCLQFYVKDQGIGIPKKDQSNLFTSFFRATNTQQIPGTGLGLSIIKESVEMIGGSISFTSQENEGTTFYVSLNIQEKQNH